MSQRSATAKPAVAAPSASTLTRVGVSTQDSSQIDGDADIDRTRQAIKPMLVPIRSGRPDEPPQPPDFSRTDLGRPDLGRPDFSAIAISAHREPRIVDADTVRAQLTRQLLTELAPAFGLDLSRLRITVTPGGGARIEARGASALQEDQEVLLHPQRYRPETERGRYLLAHEAAHAAQRRIDTPQVSTKHSEAMRIAEAEAEATALGRDFAQRRSLRRPRIALRQLAAVADTGENTEIKPTPPLAELVHTSRSRELALIRDALDGWWVSDGDVFAVMRILDSVSFPVAVAMVGALPRDHRYWLCDNINPPHMYQHRRSVLASYQALEPARFDAVDLKVMRALPDSGLDTEETDAARYVLAHLARDDVDELLASEKGDAIARLSGTPLPLPDPEKAKKIKAASDKALADEAALAQQRARILAHGNDGSANRLFEEIKQSLSAPRDDHGEPRHPSRADAVAVLNRLSAERSDIDRFHYIAEQMERAGLIDALLQLLPPDSFTGATNPEHALTLTALVESRLSIKNEQLLEDLLSYGLFDWAIRDYEALFAYRLIRAMPLAGQYRFRQRDGGKWYLRLLDNLPRDEDGMRRPGLEIRKAASKDELEEMRKQGATVQTAPGDWRDPQDSYYYNASEIQERRLDQGDARDRMDKLVAEFEEKRKGIYYDGEAIALYRKLVDLGAGSLEPGNENSGDVALREAIIRELDARGYIDELFGQLPDSFLFDQANRISTVKIMLSRDSMRVVAHARDLVSYGALDWLVWDSEAYLAFECVRALPAEERSAFIREQPELWRRIQTEMGPAMRQARDINAYVGDKAGTDRAGVLAELAEKTSWVAANEVALDSTLRMAMAMSEHRFAFDRSQEFDVVDAEPALLPLIEKYRLYNPAQGRANYRKEMLKGTRWHEEGVFASLKSFWGGLVTLWNMDVLFVDGKIGAKIDLNSVQDFMGGDIMGAQLADPAKRGSQQSAAGPDANKLTLLMDPAWLDGAGKSAELILPQLLIDSTNVQLDGSTVQTGEVDLRNLHIRAAYDGQNAGQATQAHVTLESLVAHDLLYATNSAMYTMSKLVVETLRLAAGTIDTRTGAPQGERKGRSIPFPLLVLAMLPWLVQMAAVALMATGINKVRGLRNQGLEPDNRFKPDIASRTKAIDISFSKLEAVGFATSGGQRVAHAQIDDFALGVGLNKATRLRAELASIERRKNALQSRAGDADAAKTLQALDKRRAELEAQRDTVAAQEVEYLAIQAKIRAGGLDATQQKQLQQDLDRLDFEDKGGAFLDIGKIEASGIAGTLTSKEPIVLDNVHGEGSSSALMGFLSGPTATPDELARRAAGERPPPVISKDRPADFSLELGNVHTGQLTVSGGVQSVKDIDKRLADLKDAAKRPEMKPLIESLEMLRPKAQRYEAMVTSGLSSLSQAQLDEFRGLRKLLTADAALIVESIDLTRARIDADLASGRIDLIAERAVISGLQLPQKGIAVEQIVANGIRAGAVPANGLLDWSNWKQNLRDADGKIDSLEITGARSKYHGLLFEKATLTGAYAKVKDRGNLIEAGLQQLNIEGLGLVPRLGLLNQRLSGLREKARVAEAGDKAAIEEEADKLAAKISELQGLADRRLAAYLGLEHAVTPDEIRAAKDEVAEVDGIIAYDLAQYGVAYAQLDEFGIKVAGAGDLLSDALGGGIDPLSVLERGGVTVTGAGPNDRLFKKMSLHHAQTVAHMPNKGLEADVGAFDVGETRLNLTAKKEGDSLHIEVPKFEVDSLMMDRLLLTSSAGGLDSESGFQVWSTGKSGIDKFVFDGSVRLDSKVKGSRELADYRVAHAHITHLGIGSLYGNGLGFTQLGKKFEVEIRSGAINGINADGIDIDIPEDEKAKTQITGKVGIDSIDKVVLGKAVFGAWSANSGQIDAQRIDVTLLKDGDLEASVKDLDLAGFMVRGPDGWVRFSLYDLGGHLSWKKGVLDIPDLHFGALQVHGVHWKIGEHGFVESDKTSTLSGVRISATLDTREVPAKGKKDETERELTRVRIKTLHVDKVESEHLIYQDEDNRIELRAADPAKANEKQMLGFKPLFLQNLNITDVDWKKQGGVAAGKVTLENYQGAAHYEGLKTGLKAGIGLKGSGMSAEVVGPGAYTFDVGKIEKTGGHYGDGKISTGFGTGAIIGKLAMGPDYAELHDVEILATQLDDPTYKDAPKLLKLTNAKVEKIKLKKLRQNYALSTGPDNKPVKTKTDMVMEGLEVFGIVAEGLDYDSGETKTVDAKCVATTSKQHITGTKATIDYLQVEKFTRDATGAGEVTAKIDVRPGADPGKLHPFTVKDLTADLTSSVGGVSRIKKLAAQVEGGPLTANGIKFATVTLGTRADGTPITRTSLDGTFSLTRLGLMKPDFDLGDGLTVRGPDGSIEFAGDLRFMPNDTMMIENGELTANKLKVMAGGASIDLAMAKLKGITLGMKGYTTGDFVDAFGLQAKELELKGVKLSYEIDRSAPSSPSDPAAKPKAPWVLDALGGLSGTLNVHASNVDYVGDVDVPAKISSGTIDFDNLTGDDGYFLPGDIWFFVSEKSIWARHYKIPVSLYDSTDPIPGVTPADIEWIPPMGPDDTGSEYIRTRGQLDLRKFLEGTLNKPASDKPGEPAKRLDALNTLRMSGNLGLGDGVIGAGANNVTLFGKGAGKNAFSISGASLGSNLTIKMPEFQASKSNFEMMGKAGETGLITANVTLSVTGLGSRADASGHFKFTVVLDVEKGVINDIKFGNLNYVDPKKLAAQPGPTAAQIEAKDKPAPGGCMP
jgi:hypothetical protein